MELGACALLRSFRRFELIRLVLHSRERKPIHDEGCEVGLQLCAYNGDQPDHQSTVTVIAFSSCRLLNLCGLVSRCPLP